MSRKLYRIWLCIIALMFGVSGTVNAQDFSCPIGTTAACLDYGDSVCSRLAKCVRNDAVCFDSYTCDYKGFICKSKAEERVEEIANEYDLLVRKYNTLVQENNRLVECLTYASSIDDVHGCL